MLPDAVDMFPDFSFSFDYCYISRTLLQDFHGFVCCLSIVYSVDVMTCDFVQFPHKMLIHGIAHSADDVTVIIVHSSDGVVIHVVNSPGGILTHSIVRSLDRIVVSAPDGSRIRSIVRSTGGILIRCIVHFRIVVMTS